MRGHRCDRRDDRLRGFGAILGLAVLIALAHPAAGKDLVDTLAETRSFCTLLGAIRAAGLETQLRGDGPYTLLAPTDEAFAALPRADLERLMKPANRAQLIATIKRHLLPAQVQARDMAGRRRWIRTSAGSLLFVDGTRGSLTVDDDIEVLQADIAADNGVLHIIDGVLPN